MALRRSITRLGGRGAARAVVRARSPWHDRHLGAPIPGELAVGAEVEHRWSEGEDRLIAETRARLERALTRVCPPQLRAHADDIVQQGMIRVLRIMERERERSGEGLAAPSTSYLCKVAYTTMVDELRKLRSQDRTRAEAAHGGQALPRAALAPDAAADGRAIARAIQACLERLSETRRRPVVLHLQGHSVPETSRLLGWTRKRAENQVYRGLGDLRSCLRSKGFEP